MQRLIHFRIFHLSVTQIVILIILISCTGAKYKPSATEIPSATITSAPIETTQPSNLSPSPEVTLAATPLSAVKTLQTAVVTITPKSSEAVFFETIKPDYHLSAKFGYIEHQLRVHEVITFTNTTGDILPELVFGVDAQKNGNIFTLDQYSILNTYTTEVRLENGFMFWSVEPAIQPGAFMTLTVDYQINLLFGGGATGYTKRQANFGDWYPYLVHYEPGYGWIFHESSLIGEAQYLPAANFAVMITLDQPDLIVAASQPLLSDSQQFSFIGTDVRNVTWSVSPDYRILEKNFNGISIKEYVFPEHQTAGEASLKTAIDAYQLYSEVYGELDQVHLAIVEVDFFDGMEYDGLFFLSFDYFAAYAGSPMGYLTMITAHEVAHQWWYANLANDQALEPWLDEALCTYSEKIFYQRYFPYLVDWWKVFRIERYAPAGWVDGTIYDFPNFRTYVDGIYLRGALYIEELGYEVGDEVLLKILAEYNSQHSDQMVTSTDFEQIMGHYLPQEKILKLKEGFFKP